MTFDCEIIGIDEGLKSADFENKSFRWEDTIYAFSIQKSNPVSEEKTNSKMQDFNDVFAASDNSSVSKLPHIDFKKGKRQSFEGAWMSRSSKKILV